MKNIAQLFALFLIFSLCGLAVNQLLTSGPLTPTALIAAGLIIISCGALLAHDFESAPLGGVREGAFLVLMLVFPLSSQGLFAAAQAFRGVALDTPQEAMRLYATGAFFLAFISTLWLMSSGIVSKLRSCALRIMRQHFPILP